MSSAVSILAGALLLAGSLFFLVTSVGMFRSRDAISRVNNLSPATGVGLPLIILGAVVHEAGQGDLGVLDVVKAILSIGAALVVSSVASNALARAAYRAQAGLDPRTVANALAPYEERVDPDRHVSDRDESGTAGPG